MSSGGISLALDGTTLVYVIAENIGVPGWVAPLDFLPRCFSTLYDTDLVREISHHEYTNYGDTYSKKVSFPERIFCL